MSEKTIVAWISRHPPLRAQIEELRSKLGEVEIVQITKTFRDAGDVLEEIEKANAEYAVVVLPLSMIARLVEYKGVTWLWAEMQGLHECVLSECKDFNPNTDVWLPLANSPKGRHMRFKAFHKIKAVKMELEPL